MPNRNEFSARIEEEIDDVARLLTADRAPSSLRSTVRARITARDDPRRLWRWSPVLVAAAAATILAIVWPDREPLNRPTASEAAAVVAATAAPTSRIEEESTLRDPGREVGSRATPVPANALSTSDDPPVRVELIEVEPLELAPLEVPFLMVELTDIEPLVLPQ